MLKCTLRSLVSPNSYSRLTIRSRVHHLKSTRSTLRRLTGPHLWSPRRRHSSAVPHATFAPPPQSMHCPPLPADSTRGAAVDDHRRNEVRRCRPSSTVHLTAIALLIPCPERPGVRPSHVVSSGQPPGTWLHESCLSKSQLTSRVRGVGVPCRHPQRAQAPRRCRGSSRIEEAPSSPCSESAGHIRLDRSHHRRGAPAETQRQAHGTAVSQIAAICPSVQARPRRSLVSPNPNSLTSRLVLMHCGQ